MVQKFNEFLTDLADQWWIKLLVLLLVSYLLLFADTRYVTRQEHQEQLEQQVIKTEELRRELRNAIRELQKIQDQQRDAISDIRISSMRIETIVTRLERQGS